MRYRRARRTVVAHRRAHARIMLSRDAQDVALARWSRSVFRRRRVLPENERYVSRRTFHSEHGLSKNDTSLRERNTTKRTKQHKKYDCKVRGESCSSNSRLGELVWRKAQNHRRQNDLVPSAIGGFNHALRRIGGWNILPPCSRRSDRDDAGKLVKIGVQVFPRRKNIPLLWWKLSTTGRF